jgi:hypothetical protein
MPNALRALGPALAHFAPQPNEIQVLFDQLTEEMVTAGLLAGAPSHAGGQTLPQKGTQVGGQTALAWLAEEMRGVGLLTERGSSDLLD